MHLTLGTVLFWCAWRCGMLRGILNMRNTVSSTPRVAQCAKVLHERVQLHLYGLNG
jgi:hypothetical protein